MSSIPNTPKELQALNSPYYRTLHNMFERLSQSQPDLNITILEFVESLDSLNQMKFMNILYKIEAARINEENCHN